MFYDDETTMTIFQSADSLWAEAIKKKEFRYLCEYKFSFVAVLHKLNTSLALAVVS